MKIHKVLLSVLLLVILSTSCKTIGTKVQEKWDKGFDFSYTWLGFDWSFEKDDEEVKIKADKEF